jgi:hypothetical protein
MSGCVVYGDGQTTGIITPVGHVTTSDDDDDTNTE